MLKKIFLFVLSLGMLVSSAIAATCPRCRIFNDDRASYCSNCGFSFQESRHSIGCPRCAFPNPEGSAYCSKCGFQFAYAQPIQERPEPLYEGRRHRRRHHHEEEERRQRPPRSQWQFIGKLVNTGADKLPFQGPVRRIHFKCTNGDLIIDTLFVYEGGNKNKVAVVSRLRAGQELDKDLPRAYNASGIKFSHRGNGIVEVYAQ